MNSLFQKLTTTRTWNAGVEVGVASQDDFGYKCGAFYHTQPLSNISSKWAGPHQCRDQASVSRAFAVFQWTRP